MKPIELMRAGFFAGVGFCGALLVGFGIYKVGASSIQSTTGNSYNNGSAHDFMKTQEYDLQKLSTMPHLSVDRLRKQGYNIVELTPRFYEMRFSDGTLTLHTNVAGDITGYTGDLMSNSIPN